MALLLQSCKSCNRGTVRTSPGDSLATPLPGAKDTVRTWTEQHLIQWKSWIDSSTAGAFAADSLERTAVDTLAAVDTVIMETSLFEDFKPFFVYSPDSSQVVDMVSYGNFLHKGRNGKVVLEYGEPDTEVAIVNVQTKKRERILFGGPSTVIKEAAWINDHTILIAGGVYDENGRLQAVVWKYDTQSRILEDWEQGDF